MDPNTQPGVGTVESKDLPFILGFLEYREGASVSSTSGTPDDVDCSDWD